MEIQDDLDKAKFYKEFADLLTPPYPGSYNPPGPITMTRNQRALKINLNLSGVFRAAPRRDRNFYSSRLLLIFRLPGVPVSAEGRKGGSERDCFGIFQRACVTAKAILRCSPESAASAR